MNKQPITRKSHEVVNSKGLLKISNLPFKTCVITCIMIKNAGQARQACAVNSGPSMAVHVQKTQQVPQHMAA